MLTVTCALAFGTNAKDPSNAVVPVSYTHLDVYKRQDGNGVRRLHGSYGRRAYNQQFHCLADYGNGRHPRDSELDRQQRLLRIYRRGWPGAWRKSDGDSGRDDRLPPELDQPVRTFDDVGHGQRSVAETASCATNSGFWRRSGSVGDQTGRFGCRKVKFWTLLVLSGLGKPVKIDQGL